MCFRRSARCLTVRQALPVTNTPLAPNSNLKGCQVCCRSVFRHSYPCGALAVPGRERREEARRGARGSWLRLVTVVPVWWAGGRSGWCWAIGGVVRMAAWSGGQSCLLDVRGLGMVQQLVQGGLAVAGGGLVVGRRRGGSSGMASRGCGVGVWLRWRGSSVRSWRVRCVRVCCRRGRACTGCGVRRS